MSGQHSEGREAVLLDDRALPSDSGGHRHGRPARWILVRRWLAAAALALALCAGSELRYFVYPVLPIAGAADAVVVLAGDATARLPVAERLAGSGSHVLVVSAGPGPDNASARALCSRSGQLTVYCFDVGGSDTRAEARAIGRLAAAHGWRTVTVVTSTYHVARAQLLVSRCTDARVQVVQARSAMSIRRWVNAAVHETGGLLAAAVLRGC